MVTHVAEGLSIVTFSGAAVFCQEKKKKKNVCFSLGKMDDRLLFACGGGGGGGDGCTLSTLIRMDCSFELQY